MNIILCSGAVVPPGLVMTTGFLLGVGLGLEYYDSIAFLAT